MFQFLSFVAMAIEADIWSSGAEVYREEIAEGRSHCHADELANIELSAQLMYLTEVMEQYGLINTAIGVSSAQKELA